MGLYWQPLNLEERTMKQKTRKELLKAFEDMLDLFAPLAPAFINGKGTGIYLRAEAALAQAQKEEVSNITEI